MKAFFFRIRRSGLLHGLVFITLSFLSSLTMIAIFLIGIILRFGIAQSEMSSENQYELIQWLEYHLYSIDSSSVYSFLMTIEPSIVKITESLHFYGILAILFLILLLLMFLYLICSAGYHGKEKEPYLRGLERIPYDLVLPCAIVWILYVLSRLYDSFIYGYYLEYIFPAFFFYLTILAASILLFLMITAAKVRTETLFSGMLLTKISRILLYFIQKIPSIWKALVIWGGILLAIFWYVYLSHEQAWYYYSDGPFYIIWPCIMMTLFLGGLWLFLQMDQIRRKAQMLATGKLEEKIESQEKPEEYPENKVKDKPDGKEQKSYLKKTVQENETKRNDPKRNEPKNYLKGKQTRRKKQAHQTTCPMLPSFKKCLRDLNRISEGMNLAIDEKMKSERFQTELITNVSHDLKTPLTSIINYLDFLSQEEKKENPNPEIVWEYINVLERQSVRLKKLIEDLIEASKASTGSLMIEKETCELGIFLQQIAGEYEEHLENAQLTLNLSLPKEGIYVEADGRYLWRVVDNLLQNACKYSMTGTRIYLQLQEVAGNAVIMIKNVSASQLNIPAEELMERFVRGDRSRHTEGSGLGLSIAKSLTELQDGKFDLEIDGDLFKTAVIFPICSPTSTQTED